MAITALNRCRAFILAFTLLSAVSLGGTALADQLTFSGTNQATGTIRVSIADIEALGLVEVEVFNPDEKKVELYAGVWLQDLIARYGSEETRSVHMTAIDFYEVTFQRQEWEDLRILMATQANGKHLEIEAKGPLKVIFADYDPDLAVYQEKLPKWIWMIKEIDFND